MERRTELRLRFSGSADTKQELHATVLPGSSDTKQELHATVCPAVPTRSRSFMLLFARKCRHEAELHATVCPEVPDTKQETVCAP